MYICLCNRLTDRQVRSVLCGAGSPEQVHHALGVQPRCGKCLAFVREMMGTAPAPANGARGA